MRAGRRMDMADFAIGSEREYFTMYWRAEQFADGARYVFCDEIVEYTFFHMSIN